jgi:hypothetical protein
VRLLTQLRHLELNGHAWLPASISALTAVTQLRLPGVEGELPAALGSWMPNLQVLGMPKPSGNNCQLYQWYWSTLERLPTGWSCLSVLEVAVGSSTALSQLQQYTSLKQLTLHLQRDLSLGDTLNSMSSLEVLHMTRQETDSYSRGEDVGWGGLQLGDPGPAQAAQPVAACGGSSSGMAAAIASAAGCTQLTQLQLEAEGPALEQAGAEQLFGVGQLAQLQQLHAADLWAVPLPCAAGGLDWAAGAADTAGVSRSHRPGVFSST